MYGEVINDNPRTITKKRIYNLIKYQQITWRGRKPQDILHVRFVSFKSKVHEVANIYWTNCLNCIHSNIFHLVLINDVFMLTKLFRSSTPLYQSVVLSFCDVVWVQKPLDFMTNLFNSARMLSVL